MKAYTKTVIKTISSNKSRFISMLLIILVGICFVTGVGGISPKVRNSLNEQYQNYNVYDLDLKSKSSTGFTQQEIDKITAYSGIDSFDTLSSFEIINNEPGVELNENQDPYNYRIYNYDTQDANVNQLILIEGNYPTSTNEVLFDNICQNRFTTPIEVNDEITFNFALSKTISIPITVTVVGIVNNPSIISLAGEHSLTKESSVDNQNIIIDYIFYFDQDYFAYSLPITDIYIKYSKTKDKNMSYFAHNYQETVTKENEKIKEILGNEENYAYLTIIENVSYNILINILEKIDVLALIFPIFFILVVALVILTTITRLITEERKVIGTYKSLGYSNSKIITKYLVFSLTAALIGMIIGLISGAYILPNIIYPAFKTMFILPTITSKISLSTGVISAILMLIAIILVTLYVSYKDVKENTNDLFRPKAPKIGKKILLEKIPFIWSKLPFRMKSTFRNIFRYKPRLLMIMLSMLGVTALIIAGLGLRDVSNQSLIFNGIAFSVGDSILVISIAIIVFAIVLGLLVIYNITNMCISEKNREIATLKVLGYTEYEVNGYIYREIIMISIIGLILGIPAGILLLYYIFNSMYFGSISQIKIYSYILTVILVIVIMVIVDFVLSFKIKNVNMNDSLKSNE